METKRLIQFKTIVDAGGLSKASELLAISSGGLSKSIKSLEEELGFLLFFRRGRELELTDLGKEFYDRLPDVLNAIQRLVTLDHSNTEKSPRVRITSFEVFSTYFLADFAVNFLPDAEIEIRERTPGLMEQLVASGEADYGITYEPIPQKGVEFLKVTKLTMGIFGTKEFKKSVHKFSELPFAIPITPLDGAPSGTKGLDGWPDHIFERQIKYRVEMMETAIQLCLKNHAVSFLPVFIANYVNKGIASSAEKLLLLKAPNGFKTVHRDVYIILRKGDEENAIVKKMAKALRMVCA